MVSNTFPVNNSKFYIVVPIMYSAGSAIAGIASHFAMQLKHSSDTKILMPRRFATQTCKSFEVICTGSLQAF